jgi:hypothetical protein
MPCKELMVPSVKEVEWFPTVAGDVVAQKKLLFLPGNKSRYLGSSVRSAVTKAAGLSRLLDWVKFCLRKFDVTGAVNYSYSQSHSPTNAHNRKKNWI